jgi:hypothetical protein
MGGLAPAPRLGTPAYPDGMPDMTTQAVAHAHGFGATQRRDHWKIGPLATAVGLLSFVVYSTWAALQGANYEHGPYLSPFYSPLIFGHSEHAWVQLPAGQSQPAWWPGFLPFSAALLVLWAPGLFRFTCYYYRKAYYRSIWMDPVACGVGEARKSYWGEKSLPLVLQNAHRFFAYIAVLFILILSYDAVRSYIWTDPDGSKHFGMGLGSLVLTINPIFLGCYTFGCHSLRHLVGGKKDCFSCGGGVGYARFKLWSGVTRLNEHHQLWAWISLFGVGFADIYVRFIACAGHDVRFF